MPPVTAWVLVAVVLTTAPLAVRRKYPISTFCVILAALIAGRGNATAFTFAAAIFAAYSAVVYSSHRLLALVSLAVGAISSPPSTRTRHRRWNRAVHRAAGAAADGSGREHDAHLAAAGRLGV